MSEQFHPENPHTDGLPISEEEVSKIVESINSSSMIVDRATTDPSGTEARDKLIVEKVNKDLELVERILANPIDIFSSIPDAYHRRTIDPAEQGDPDF